MKTQVQSYSSSLNPALKEFFVPNAPQIFVYIIISVLLMLCLSSRAIWSYFNNQVLPAQSNIDLLGAGRTLDHRVLGVFYQGRLPVIIFWIFVGCAIYIAGWFIKSLALNLRNDLVADNYIHPSHYSRSSYWHSIILRKGFFVISAATLIAYLFTCFKLLPLLARLSYSEISSFSPLRSVLAIALVVLATTICLYILTILVRIVAHCWRFIYADL